MVNKFLSEASRNGSKYVNLTDAKDNEKTNKFYQSIGFTIYHAYVTHEGREMNEYRISLENAPIGNSLIILLLEN